MEDNPRMRLLRYIAEHTAVSVKQMKAYLGMSTGTIYYYLSQLERVLKRDEAKRFYMTAQARLMLDKYHGDYSKVDSEFEKIESGNIKSAIRKYRSVYDTIAAILDTKEPVFTVVRVVRKARLPAKRAEVLLSFLKGKGLIEEVWLEKPKQSQKRRYLKVTAKGLMFLRRFRQLQTMIK